MVVERIISGGQTGVDRAALDFAMDHGFDHGGFCPKGRRAEDGVIPLQYLLVETATFNYAERTEKNVDAADGTLILHRGDLSGGTKYTAELCEQKGKPLFLIDVENGANRTATFRTWVKRNNIKILNVAGPRESQKPGISSQAAQLLGRLLDRRMSVRA